MEAYEKYCSRNTQFFFFFPSQPAVPTALLQDKNFEQTPICFLPQWFVVTWLPKAQEQSVPCWFGRRALSEQGTGPGVSAVSCEERCTVPQLHTCWACVGMLRLLLKGEASLLVLVTVQSFHLSLHLVNSRL